MEHHNKGTCRITKKFFLKNEFKRGSKLKKNDIHFESQNNQPWCYTTIGGTAQ